MRVAVIGAGSWGTTVASLLSVRSDTVLWAREPEVVATINARHENPLFLPGVPLPPTLRATGSLEDAVRGVDVIFVAVPSQFFRSVLEEVDRHVGPGICLLSLAKGIETGSLKRMSEVAADVLTAHDPGMIGVISGPNIAREVMAGEPSATVVAVPDQDVAVSIQGLLMRDTFRVYTNTDVVGCEIGGAVKNVIAIAAGMAYGLGYGENTKAALVTRGLAELTRLGIALGGDPLTFLGLAGIGDLVVTCSSLDSRNHYVGRELGKGQPLATILAGLQMVAEGVRTTPAVLELARLRGIDVPICEQVGAVLYEGRGPVEAVAALMHREAKSELHGIARSPRT